MRFALCLESAKPIKQDQIYYRENFISLGKL